MLWDSMSTDNLINTPKHIALPGYAEFKKKLERAGNMIDGLYIVKDFLQPYGVGDLLYGYMLHAKSHVRNEQILISTFPKTIRKMFVKDGGTISFRFGDMLPTMKKPIFYDLDAALQPKNPLFSFNKSSKRTVMYGYHQAWIVPFLTKGLCGFGFLMLYQNPEKNAVKIDVDLLEQFGFVYHMSMRMHKQMANHFGLSQKQRIVLAGAAKGHTASDIATQLDLSERTIELRLQEARKKLKARTTAEAVYKALAYLVLPCHDEN